MLARLPDKKRATAYLLATGAVPITIIERDGVASIVTGKITSGTSRPDGFTRI